ncbi:dihydrodipicolinate synthase family protein, partial [bacterium]|nr:dihydrodipicolinate synthase family protein [bacterium]
FYALNFEEFKRMVDILVEVVSPTGIPTQVGCISPNTRDTIRMMEYIADKGVDGAQVALPFWMELTDKEVLQFFSDISKACPSLPIIHYNIPRAKRFLYGPDYQRILEVASNLIGVKFTFASANFGKLQEALILTPTLSYFVGENLLVSAMQLGARGSYSSVVCTNPNFMLKMFKLAEEKNWEKALKMQKLIAKFFIDMDLILDELELGGIDPVADKGFGVASGFMVGHQRIRPPYIGWSDKGLREVKLWLEKNYPQLVWQGL